MSACVRSICVTISRCSSISPRISLSKLAAEALVWLVDLDIKFERAFSHATKSKEVSKRNFAKFPKRPTLVATKTLRKSLFAMFRINVNSKACKLIDVLLLVSCWFLHRYDRQKTFRSAFRFMYACGFAEFTCIDSQANYRRARCVTYANRVWGTKSKARRKQRDVEHKVSLTERIEVQWYCCRIVISQGRERELAELLVYCNPRA